MNNIITVMPVSASGVGNYMEVNINGNKYQSTLTHAEFNEYQMEAGINEICAQLPNEESAIRAAFSTFLIALKNTASEEKHKIIEEVIEQPSTDSLQMGEELEEDLYDEEDEEFVEAFIDEEYDDEESTI